MDGMDHIKKGVTRDKSQLRKNYGTFGKYRHPGHTRRTKTTGPMDTEFGERAGGVLGEGEQKPTPRSVGTHTPPWPLTAIGYALRLGQKKRVS